MKKFGIKALFAAMMVVSSGQTVSAYADDVTVIEAGASDRAVMVLKPTAGFSTTSLTSMKMTMEMSGPMPMKLEMPEVTTKTKATVVSVGADGSCTVESEVLDAGVGGGGDMAVAQEMQAQVVRLKGIGVQSTLDKAGKPTDIVVTDSGTAAPEIIEDFKKNLWRGQVVWPSQAIGVGAKWKVTSQVVENGLTINQTAIYTLKAVDGAVAKLSVVIDQGAKLGAVNIPNVPPDATVNLDAFSGKGEGTISLSLINGVPTDVVLSHDMTFTLTIRVVGATQEITNSVSLGLTTHPI